MTRKCWWTDIINLDLFLIEVKEKTMIYFLELKVESQKGNFFIFSLLAEDWPDEISSSKN